MILDRIDADLHFKSLSLSGLLDDDDSGGGFVYTTYKAALELKKKLRPYVDYSGIVGKDPTLEEMAAMYMERFGKDNNG